MPACPFWSITDAEVRAGYESTPGTPPVDGYLFNAKAFNATVSRDKSPRPLLDGTAVNAKASAGARTASNSLEIPMQPSMLGIFLYSRHGAPTSSEVSDATWGATTAYTLGQVIKTTDTVAEDLSLKVTVAGTSGATEPDLTAVSAGDTVTDGTVTYLVIPRLWKHIFTPTTGCQTSMTLEAKVATNEYIRCTGSKINNKAVNPTADGTNLTATIDFDCFDADGTVTSTFITGTETDLTGETEYLEHFQGTYSGSETMSLVNWSFSEEKPLTARQTLNGSPNASVIFEGKYNPNGSVTFFGEATDTQAVFTKARNHTSSDLTLQIINSYLQGVKYIMPTMTWGEGLPGIDAETIEPEISVDFMGDTAYTIELYNNDASYPLS